MEGSLSAAWQVLPSVLWSSTAPSSSSAAVGLDGERGAVSTTATPWGDRALTDPHIDLSCCPREACETLIPGQHRRATGTQATWSCWAVMFRRAGWSKWWPCLWEWHHGCRPRVSITPSIPPPILRGTCTPLLTASAVALRPWVQTKLQHHLPLEITGQHGFHECVALSSVSLSHTRAPSGNADAHGLCPDWAGLD